MYRHELSSSQPQIYTFYQFLILGRFIRFRVNRNPDCVEGNLMMIF